jgi:hypothetical protein
MKRKKDPALQEVLDMRKAIGPMLEDFEHHYDAEADAWIFTFKGLRMGQGGYRLKDWELNLPDARLYLAGLIDGAAFSMNLAALDERRNNTFGGGL